MVVEASTWETGVLVGSSAREIGGDMEQNVDKDANDDHWKIMMKRIKHVLRESQKKLRL